MKPSELLHQKGWCQDFLAINHICKEVHPNDETAMAFCAIGAIMKCYPDIKKQYAVRTALKNYLYECGYSVCILSSWNDKRERTKEQVIEAFEAIGE